MSPQLILASSSPFRKQLLEKLNIPFETCSPNIDESAHRNESPEVLVMRLAQEKAVVAASRYTQGLVIGSDQVAVINKRIVGKPLTHENAVKQLTQASNQIITFYTGLTVHNISTGNNDSRVETFNVHFRTLTQEQIEYYLHTEHPYFCAGSFKCEGLGIALFTQLEGKDPNTLVGLPLITLIDMLALQGYYVLASNAVS